MPVRIINAIAVMAMSQVLACQMRSHRGGGRRDHGRRGRRWRCNDGGPEHVGLGQGVAEFEAEECLLPRTDGALHKQLQAPRLRGIEPGIGRHGEQRDLGQAWRAFGGYVTQAPVVAIAKAQRAAVLDHFDPVEDAAAHVAGALERIDTMPGHQDGRLPGREVVRQALIALVAQQAAANGRRAHQRGEELDEGVVGIAGFRIGGGASIAAALIGLIYLADREMQAPHGSVAEQALPVPYLPRAGGEGCGRGGCRRLRRDVTDAPSTDQADGGADDAVGHHQHGDRRAADDIGLGRTRLPARDRRHGGADQAVHRRHDALFGNADQHDRLLVLPQPDAADHSFGINRHQQLDRLAGIAGGVGDIGIEIDMAEQPAAGISGRQWRLTFGRTNAVGTGKDLGRRYARKEFGETCRGSWGDK